MPRHRTRLVTLAATGVAVAFLGLVLSGGRAATGRFSDVSPEYPYAPAIIELADRAIVNGHHDLTFDPEAPVLRQQFAKMLTATFGFEVSEADRCSFADVSVGGPNTLYPDNYIAVCVSRGIIRGTTATRFSPYDKLTRAQMISLVVRAVDSLAGGPLPAPKGRGTSSWGGSDPEHGASIQWAESEGLLNGLPLDTLDPRGFATRGEVAQVLHNVEQDVRYYGVRADGVTDDSKAITNAMDGAAAAKSPLHFGPGTYVLKNELTPPDGVTLIGSGPSSVLYMPELPGSSQTFIFERSNPKNITIRDFTLRGDGPTMNESGLYLVGARDSTLKNLRLEDLRYGMKLGEAHQQAQRWTIEDISATNCRTPMYIQDVEDSAFTRMSLQGVAVDHAFDHCLYMSEGCYRLTFTDVTLVGGGGYGLHLFRGSRGTTSYVTFNNLTIDATTGRWPMCITDGFSNIAFHHVNLRMLIDEVCIRVTGCDNILFDGLTASGGHAVIGTFAGQRAGHITLKVVAYDEPSILSPNPGARGITDLVVESATRTSTGTLIPQERR